MKEKFLMDLIGCAIGNIFRKTYLLNAEKQRH